MSFFDKWYRVSVIVDGYCYLLSLHVIFYLGCVVRGNNLLPQCQRDVNGCLGLVVQL